MTSTVAGPVGLQPERWEFLVTNRTGGTRDIGDVVQLDMAQSDGDVDDSVVGSVNSSLANVIQPATANLRSGIFVVITGGDRTDNGRMRVVLRGIVDINILNGNGDTGEGLVAANAANTLIEESGATDAKIIGKLLEDPGSDSETLTRCLFDGWNGFGQDTTT